KRWRKRHGEPEWHVVAYQTLHHAKQRNVGLCYCLKEPVFLEEMFMLRMPNERKMSVENECKGTGHRVRVSLSFRAKRETSQRLFARTNDDGRSFIAQVTGPGASTPKPRLGALVVCATRDDRLQCPAKILKTVQPLFYYIQTGGVTQPDRAVVTKRSSWNNGDARFAQQTVGEIL